MGACYNQAALLGANRGEHDRFALLYFMQYFIDDTGHCRRLSEDSKNPFQGSNLEAGICTQTF